MCKILCLSSHDPAERDAIIAKVWKEMATSERDGYGAAWFSASGEIGFYKRRYPVIRVGDGYPFTKTATKSPTDFDQSNDVPSDGGFLIIHARTATNPINLANTHPFIDVLPDGRKVALIHNGVVRSDKYVNELAGCTCDSELILRAYIDGGIDNVERYIEGRFAFMYLEYVPPSDDEIALAAAENREPLGKKTLHVAKEKYANLYVGTQSDDTIVFATTEYLLKEVGAISDGEFLDNHRVVLSGKTEFEMDTFKSLTMFEKKAAGYFKPDPPIVQQQHQPRQHQTYPANHTPIGETSTIDKALAELEAEEIKALELEAIEQYPG
jgi:predicted glutamine amidotransferase